MAIDKKTFLKVVTVLVDSREREWTHIQEALEAAGAHYERRKLDYGDYSFRTDNRDFSMSCVIERKADVDELYGNFMSDKERIAKEFDVGNRLSNQFVLMIESVGSLEELRDYVVPKWKMEQQKARVRDEIGSFCYNTLQSWQAGSRYGFRTVFVKDKKNSAAKILEEFYYYWRNYSELVAARKFA